MYLPLNCLVITKIPKKGGVCVTDFNYQQLDDTAKQRHIYVFQGQPSHTLQSLLFVCFLYFHFYWRRTVGQLLQYTSVKEGRRYFC